MQREFTISGSSRFNKGSSRVQDFLDSNQKLLFFLPLSFESWFDISTITSDAENIVANEREQNILHMLHQVSST